MSSPSASMGRTEGHAAPTHEVMSLAEAYQQRSEEVQIESPVEQQQQQQQRKEEYEADARNTRSEIVHASSEPTGSASAPAPIKVCKRKQRHHQHGSGEARHARHPRSHSNPPAALHQPLHDSPSRGPYSPLSTHDQSPYETATSAYIASGHHLHKHPYAHAHSQSQSAGQEKHANGPSRPLSSASGSYGRIQRAAVKGQQVDRWLFVLLHALLILLFIVLLAVWGAARHSAGFESRLNSAQVPSAQAGITLLGNCGALLIGAAAWTFTRSVDLDKRVVLGSNASAFRLEAAWLQRVPANVRSAIHSHVMERRSMVFRILIPLYLLLSVVAALCFGSALSFSLQNAATSADLAKRSTTQATGVVADATFYPYANISTALVDGPQLNAPAPSLLSSFPAAVAGWGANNFATPDEPQMGLTGYRLHDAPIESDRFEGIAKVAGFDVVVDCGMADDVNMTVTNLVGLLPDTDQGPSLRLNFTMTSRAVPIPSAGSLPSTPRDVTFQFTDDVFFQSCQTATNAHTRILNQWNGTFFANLPRTAWFYHISDEGNPFCAPIYDSRGNTGELLRVDLSAFNQSDVANTNWNVQAFGCTLRSVPLKNLEVDMSTAALLPSSRADRSSRYSTREWHQGTSGGWAPALQNFSSWPTPLDSWSQAFDLSLSWYASSVAGRPFRDCMARNGSTCHADTLMESNIRRALAFDATKLLQANQDVTVGEFGTLARGQNTLATLEEYLSNVTAQILKTYADEVYHVTLPYRVSEPENQRNRSYAALQSFKAQYRGSTPLDGISVRFQVLLWPTMLGFVTSLFAAALAVFIGFAR